MADDPVRFPENHAFGRGSSGSEPFGNILKANQLEGMKDKFNDIMES